ncbi:MAG: hypothetical protein O2899_01135 [Bacteroidetes bacterium]|nr:hypothetical protein [Bacteroidota bacterium]
MKPALRIVLAVLAGFGLWGIVWNAFTSAMMALFPDDLVANEPITGTGFLVMFILVSAAVSVLAGWASVRVGQDRAATAVRALAIVNLVFGIAVEVSYWDLMPAWYHIIFLILVVPATLYGGRLGSSHAG